MILAVFVAPTIRADDSAETQKKDLDAFKKYLADKHPGKKWSAGPTALDSKELREAYPGKRFYFVHSAPPLPPGAPLKDLLERHRERMIDYQKNYISVTVEVSGDDIKPLGRAPADLGKGLMRVRSEDDAKVAAAAVLSIVNDGRGGPGVVTAAEVKVAHEDKIGWTCQVDKPFAFQGIVKFTPRGGLEQVSKVSTAPLPP